MLYDIWMFLPLILIPLTAVLYHKISKLSSFLEELLKSGRISRYEFYELRPEKKADGKDTSVQPPKTGFAEAKVFFGEQASSGEKIVPDATASADAMPAFQKAGVVSENSTENQTVDNPDNSPSFTPANPSTYHYEEPMHTGASSVLFGIGVVFVILSGIIFSMTVWSYLSYPARTGMIILASLIFFGISALAHKKFGLKNTSVSFYLLGTIFLSIAFVAAGHFGLFGKWFSLTGNGECLFLAVAALIVALLSAEAIRIYRKDVFLYFSLYSAVVTVVLIFEQLCGKYEATLLLACILSAIVTAACYYRKNIDGRTVIAPIINVLISVRVILAVEAVGLLISEFTDWSLFSYLISLLYIAELSFYGIRKKSKKQLAVQGLLVLFTGLHFFIRLSENSLSDAAAQMIFQLFLLACIFFYRYYKPIYTAFADAVFLLAAFINAAVMLGKYQEISLSASESALYGIIAMLALEAAFFITALDRNNFFSRFFRIVLPIPLFIIASEIAQIIGNEYDTNCYCYAYAVCAAVWIVTALICGYINHGDKRYLSIKYSFEIFTGILLVLSAMGTADAAESIIMILLSISAFVVMQTSDKQLHSVLPVFSLFIAVDELIYNLTLYGGIFDLRSGDIFVIASILICAAMTLLSRLLFGRKFRLCENGKDVWDTLWPGFLFSILFASNGGMLFGPEARTFIMLSEAAVFAADFYRKEHSKNGNNAAISVSAGIFAYALIRRPFLVVDEKVISAKIAILIIVALGFLIRWIWRENKEQAQSFGTAVHMLAFILLFFDALLNETLLNCLLVLCIILVILLYSFMAKKKIWFLASAAGLVGLTLYITRDFLAEIEWWVYLLLVGILLLLVASVNEYFKGKGENLKKKAGRFFEDWTWR